MFKRGQLVSLLVGYLCWPAKHTGGDPSAHGPRFLEQGEQLEFVREDHDVIKLFHLRDSKGRVYTCPMSVLREDDQ